MDIHYLGFLQNPLYFPVIPAFQTVDKTASLRFQDAFNLAGLFG
jgi:hypothetical protein